jgi:hypothetical protein
LKLLTPDILELTRELSLPVLGVALLVGLFLWLFGGTTHRFWMALVVTLAAGLVGLYYGPDHELQPLVAGLLLALAAGALSLSLVRIALFVASGVAALALCRSLATGWNEIVCFLAGGLIGVLLYRPWVTLLSAFTGSLLMGYATLSLLERTGKVPSTELAGTHGPLFNWAIAGWTGMGLLAQYLISRRRKRKQEARAKKAAAPPPDPKLEVHGPPPRLLPWWRRLPLPTITWRKAG